MFKEITEWLLVVFSLASIGFSLFYTYQTISLP